MQCGQVFDEEIDLALHEARAHNKRSVKCDKCGETFVGQTTLQTRMRKHKNCEYMYVCIAICFSSFYLPPLEYYFTVQT